MTVAKIVIVTGTDSNTEPTCSWRESLQVMIGKSIHLKEIEDAYRDVVSLPVQESL